jgi:hypothetical protein
MTYYQHKLGTYIFFVEIQLFVTAKSDQDADPRFAWICIGENPWIHIRNEV